MRAVPHAELSLAALLPLHITPSLFKFLDTHQQNERQLSAMTEITTHWEQEWKACPRQLAED